MIHVYYAVGHGLTDAGRLDPGATGRAAGGRLWTEQTAGDVAVAAAAASSQRAGLTVTHEAYTDDDSWEGTVRRANRLEVDLVVALHHDTATAPTGSFAYYWPSSTEGRKLAEAIIAAIAAAGGPTRRAYLPGRPPADGPVAGRRLGLLRATKAPAVLVELGPIAHHHLDEPDELAAAGRAVAAGVHAYLGIDDHTRAAGGQWPELTPLEGIERLARGLRLDHGTRTDPADVGRTVVTVESRLGL